MWTLLLFKEFFVASFNVCTQTFAQIFGKMTSAVSKLSTITVEDVQVGLAVFSTFFEVTDTVLTVLV